MLEVLFTINVTGLGLLLFILALILFAVGQVLFLGLYRKKHSYKEIILVPGAVYKFIDKRELRIIHVCPARRVYSSDKQAGLEVIYNIDLHSHYSTKEELISFIKENVVLDENVSDN